MGIVGTTVVLQVSYRYWCYYRNSRKLQNEVLITTENSRKFRCRKVKKNSPRAFVLTLPVELLTPKTTQMMIQPLHHPSFPSYSRPLLIAASCCPVSFLFETCITFSSGPLPKLALFLSLRGYTLIVRPWCSGTSVSHVRVFSCLHLFIKYW